MGMFSEKYTKEPFYLKPATFFIQVSNQQKRFRHAHKNRVEIIGMLSGSACYKIDGKEIRLSAGQILWIDMQVYHEFFVQPGARHMVVEFEIVQTKGLISYRDLILTDPYVGKLFAQKPLFLHQDAFEGELLILKELIQACYVHQAAYAEMLLHTLLCKAAKNYVCKDQTHMFRSAYMQKAVLYIEQNYAKEISLADAAAFLKLNASYFSRLFKQQMGMNFTEFLNRFRINRAKIVLSDPEETVLGVSDKVGFSSRQYFTYLFRKYEGLSPKQYKEWIKKA